MILSVPHEEIDKVWPKVVDWLQAAIDRTKQNKFYRVSDIKKSILEKDKQLWIATDGKEIDAVLVTAIEEYPTGARELLVFMVGGKNLDKWASQARVVFSKFAKEYGCQWFSCEGRKGWERLYKNATIVRKYRMEI